MRTVARYQPGSGRDQVVSVTGPAVRVTFDPPFAAVLRQFAVRGLRALFDGGDHLLFLVCLLLPMRRTRSVFGLVAAVVLGQAVAMVVSVNRPPMSADWMAGAAMVAASAIVIATLQGVVRARMRWTILIALAFGALNGCLLGQAAVASAPFGGEHSSAAMLTFAAVVLIGELWLAALAWAFRAWLDERGLPDRVAAIVGLAMVAHQALHRVVDRAEIVAQGGSLGDERVLVWLTLAWIGAVLLVAASNAVAGDACPERACSEASRGIMTTRVVQPGGGTQGGRRERIGVFALAGLVVTAVVVYLALNATTGGDDSDRRLLPYQALAAALPESDQQQFRALRERLLAAEAARVRTSRWPDVTTLALPGSDYTWTRFERGVVINYLGRPADPAKPAWLLEIQEPEPGTAPDPAPNDEEHHRLPDGTTLHVYVWTHRLGGQLASDFVPQPQNTGWVEVFSQVPNPVYAIRR